MGECIGATPGFSPTQTRPRPCGDTKEFRHQWGDGMMQWRDAQIIPRYNQAGVSKFAFIANPNYPGPTVEGGATPAPEGPANFPTGWFKSRETAYQWLAT